MRARVLREWLQKHPTPRATDGDFHWYPGAIGESLRGELLAGAAGELTLWLAPGRIALARRFPAIAPADGRSYTGVAVVVVEGPASSHASAAALLAAAALPASGPWSPVANAVPSDAAIIREPAPLTPALAPSAALVAAAWRGGNAPLVAADLGTIAAIETWLPEPARRASRKIVFETPDAAALAVPATTPRETANASCDLAAAWLAAAIGARGEALERARDAWQMVNALAAVEERSVVDTFELLAALDRAWGSLSALREHLAAAGVPVPARAHAADARTQWSRVLHAWGRGWLAPSARDALAAVIVRRAVADQLAADAPDGWRRTLRWDSLLPHAAADDLERRAVARLPALAEVHHG